MSKNRTEANACDEAPYSSYLLRLWQEESGGESRALLQEVMSGESCSFASLESLFAFLRASQEGLEGADPSVRPRG